MPRDARDDTQVGAFHWKRRMGGHEADHRQTANRVPQVRVGHGVFGDGRDDTAKHLAEVARTRRRAPLLLVFHDHRVEVLPAAGYRPALRAETQRYTDRALAGDVGGAA